MAPMVIDQDPVNDQIYEDNLFDFSENGINFDEIASLADMLPDFDNSKLMDENGLEMDLTPAAPQAVVVQQTANPDNSALFNTFADYQEMQPVSPDMFLLPASNATLLQAVSDPSFLQPTQDAAFLQPTYGALQPASPGTLLQPASPGTLLQPASPGTLFRPASPGASLPSISSQCSSSEPDYLTPQPVTKYVIVKPEVVPVLSPRSVKVEVPSSEEVADMPKKRGRKPKYPKGMAPRRSRPKKPKVYEMGPLPNELEEKKRKNAINAKLHRDKQKNIRDSLSNQLKAVTAERDGLLKLVEQLKQSEASLRLALSKGM